MPSFISFFIFYITAFSVQIIDCELDKEAIGMGVWASFLRLGKEGLDGIIHYRYKFHPEL